jgi:hypothetical protein
VPDFLSESERDDCCQIRATTTAPGVAGKLHCARNTREVRMPDAVPVLRSIRALLMVCAVVLAAAASATAEPLTISRGFFTVGGSRGVDFVFNPINTSFGAPAPFVGEGNGTPPPELASFFAPPRTPSVFDFTFSNVLDPSSNSSCPGCSYAGKLTFRQPSVPTPHDEDAFRVPFTMTGAFEGFAPHSSTRVFQHDIEGSGHAIVQDFAVEFFFEPSAAPTPEPASALLLLTGVGFAARRFRRNRREAQV